MLRQQRGVKAAVVEVRESGAGDKRLRAYVVVKEGEEMRVQGPRGLLRQQLPEYMVPVEWVKVEGLARTASGKVDRRRLEAAAVAAEAEEKPDQEREPTAVEEIVCGIWSAVLGVAEVGLEENFFDVGGHSLLATQVVARVRQALGVEISLRSLFESPTIAQLAREIEQAKAGDQGQRKPALSRVSRDAYRTRLPS